MKKMEDSMKEIIQSEKIMAVIRSDSVDRCVEIARSCYRGGIKILEITFTVPDAEKAISIISRELPEAYVGAGTVLTDGQFDLAIRSGARYVVSPHLSEELAIHSRAMEVLYLPGIMTPTEYVKATGLGLSMVKVFPGDVLTPAFVKSLRGPFPEARCVVSGGVSLDNINLWFEAGTAAVGIGSDLTKGTPLQIEEKARQYSQKIKDLQS